MFASTFKKTPRLLSRGITTSHTFLQTPGSGKSRTVTLIPGQFIGPEVTKSVLDIFAASQAPVNFDVIENFSFKDTASRELLKKNKNILVGNAGTPGSKYVENTALYRYLDLFVNGKNGA